METATGMTLQECADATGIAKMELASSPVTPSQPAQPNLEEWIARYGGRARIPILAIYCTDGPIFIERILPYSLVRRIKQSTVPDMDNVVALFPQADRLFNACKVLSGAP
jgi:hypothetical protein